MIIGLVGSVRWIISIFVTLDAPVKPQQTSSTINPTELLPDQACAESGVDCPWSHVFSDMTNRLQLLELAYKEQVFARESITREITNQSDIYGGLETKMALFLEKLDNMSFECLKLDKKLNDLSSRVYSDGNCILFCELIKISVLLNTITRRETCLHAYICIDPMISFNTKIISKCKLRNFKILPGITFFKICIFLFSLFKIEFVMLLVVKGISVSLVLLYLVECMFPFQKL